MSVNVTTTPCVRPSRLIGLAEYSIGKLARSQHRVNRTRLSGVWRAVRARVMHRAVQVAPEQRVARVPEHLGGGAIDERAAALAILAEHAFACGFEQQLQALRHLGALGFGAAATQDSADARPQHDRVERLRHEVLGAHLDGADRVLLIVQRGEHDHRDILQLIARLHALEHLEPVHARHKNIEQHEVEGLAAETVERRRTAGLGDGGEALALEAPRENLAIVGIVVDYQDAPARARRTRRTLSRNLRPGGSGRRVGAAREAQQIARRRAHLADLLRARAARHLVELHQDLVDALERGLHHGAQLGQRLLADVTFGGKRLLDAVDDLPRDGEHLVHQRLLGPRALVLRLVAHHLGVADQVIQRRSHGVPDTRDRVRIHEVAYFAHRAFRVLACSAAATSRRSATNCAMAARRASLVGERRIADGCAVAITRGASVDSSHFPRLCVTRN
jgi:hypothetical protein